MALSAQQTAGLAMNLGDVTCRAHDLNAHGGEGHRLSGLLDADIARAQGGSNALGWILEMLEGDPTYLHRRMFGCDAAYIEGLLCLVTASNGEPWNGLLACTSIDRQPALRADWPALSPHAVLGKWLYLSQDDPDFEATAHALVRRVIARDPRIGVEPKPKKKKKKSLHKRQAKAARVKRTSR